MEKSDLEIFYKFFISCPFCGKTMDLSDGDHDSNGEFSTPIFNNKWDSLKGKIVSCSFCNQDFKIGEIEI